MQLDPRRIEVMDDQVAQIMRRMSPAQKIEMIDRLWAFGWSLVEAGVRNQHPEWDDARVRRETAGRMSRGAAV